MRARRRDPVERLAVHVILYSLRFRFATRRGGFWQEFPWAPTVCSEADHRGSEAARSTSPPKVRSMPTPPQGFFFGRMFDA